MSFDTRGRIHLIRDTQQVTDNFRKREVIIEMADTKPEYPQFVTFEMTGDRCDKLDKREVGELVTVRFDLNGRRWESREGEIKWFNTIRAWAVASLDTDERADLLALRDDWETEQLSIDEYEKPPTPPASDIPF